MPEPQSAHQGTSHSVFQNVTSPWMQSANIDEPKEETEELPLEDYTTKDEIFGLEGGVEVKDARREEAREAERARQLEIEKEEDLVLDRLEEERFKLCRRYFLVGCCGLPLLLFVNVIYFAKDFRAVTGNFRIRKYLWLSLIVALLELFLWILWFTVFQIFGDGTFEILSIYYVNVTVGYLI